MKWVSRLPGRGDGEVAVIAQDLAGLEEVDGGLGSLVWIDVAINGCLQISFPTRAKMAGHNRAPNASCKKTRPAPLIYEGLKHLNEQALQPDPNTALIAHRTNQS